MGRRSFGSEAFERFSPVPWWSKAYPGRWYVGGDYYTLLHTIYAFPQSPGDELHLVLANDQGRGEGQHVIVASDRVGVLADDEAPLLATGDHRGHLLHARRSLALLVLHQLDTKEEPLAPYVSYVGVVLQPGECFAQVLAHRGGAPGEVFFLHDLEVL